MWWVSKVDARNAFVFPTLAKRSLIVQKAELFNDVVHYEIYVDLRLAAHTLFVGFTQLTNLADVKPLIGIQLEHPHHDPAELWRILLAQRWVLAFRNSLK